MKLNMKFGLTCFFYELNSNELNKTVQKPIELSLYQATVNPNRIYVLSTAERDDYHPYVGQIKAPKKLIFEQERVEALLLRAPTNKKQS